MDHHRFCADFLQPQGLRYFLSADSQVFNQEIKGIIALHRPGGVASADEAGIARIGRLKPHLVRALRVYWNRIKLEAGPQFFQRNLRSYYLTIAEQRLASTITYGEGLAGYADRCRVSINTVHTHHRRIKNKLDCQTQAALITHLFSIARDAEPTEISPSATH